MKLDKQISKDGDNKEEERKEVKTEKETKEAMNERLAGTSTASLEFPIKLFQDQYTKISFDDETEKVEQELGEKSVKEQLEMSRIDSKLTLVNLETIKEGEVLEIPPEATSPQGRDSIPGARFYFDDNTVSRTTFYYFVFRCMMTFFGSNVIVWTILQFCSHISLTTLACLTGWD